MPHAMTPSARSPFRGRRACIATKHGKEAALGPVIQDSLGMTIEPVPAGFDSDRFGTFSGTIPRPGSALDAARAKARLAMELGADDVVIASEGSFSPHPEVPMVTLAVELALLIDARNGIEVVGWHRSLQSNHASCDFESAAQAVTFAQQVGFPSHGVLLVIGDPAVRVFEHASRAIELQKQAEQCLSLAATMRVRCRALSDMRAHRNPTRMAAIALAGQDLVQRALTSCPRCEAPGFGLDRHVQGLPCRDCGAPTSFTRVEVYACPQCRHETERERPDGLLAAEPGNCPECNP
jgi:hypothetical protein